MTEALAVSELFYSLQGESTRAGLPCVFVRLADCNLRCTYCDARYTWEEAGTPMEPDAILAWVEAYPGVMVEITGGEPLLQAGVYPLMDVLLAKGRTVLLETNGSLSLDRVPDGVAVIMDIKCPGSGMVGHNLPDNLDMLGERSRHGCRDEIKFVLSSIADFHWAREQVMRENLIQTLPVLFSPVRSRLDPAELAHLILEHRLPVRLQLQLHNQLWPNRTRGV